MRILFSAFACISGRGSEPGVGWHWALTSARQGHEVWVITRSMGKEANEAAVQSEGLKHLHFIYYDLPGGLQTKLNMHLSYELWQFGAYLRARDLARETKFDLVQHVTFASVRQPSFMGLLGIPFIFGPIGGGDMIPPKLLKSFSGSTRRWEQLRIAINAFVRFDPLMHLTFATAEKILVTTPDTLAVVPRRYHCKARVQPTIGIESVSASVPCRPSRKPFKILYAGLLLYLKGVHLALKAFQQVLESMPDARFTVVGKGRDGTMLRQLACDLGIENSIDWVPWIERNQLFELYADHDVFLFPSLRDSGGLVVLEALSMGVPVVCLDLGGPAIAVDSTCGLKASARLKREDEVVLALKEHLLTLGRDEVLRGTLAQGALRRASQCTWENVVRQVMNDCETAETGNIQ